MAFGKARISAFFLLIRWGNCLLAGFAVFVGFFACDFGVWDKRLLFAILATMLITGGGNASNDIADLAVDRQAKPNRPLPSGRLSISQAWGLTVLFVVVGIGFGSFVSCLHGAVAASAVAYLVFYNFVLKRVALAGNAAVAVLSGLPFVYGGLLSPAWRWSLIPFVFAVLVHLAREILKSVEDVQEDKYLGIRTIAAFVPPQVLRIVAGLLLFLVMVLAMVPFVKGWYGCLYLIVLVAGVYVPNIVLYRFLFADQWIRSFGKLHKLLKLQMLGGTIAILVSRVR